MITSASPLSLKYTKFITILDSRSHIPILIMAMKIVFWAILVTMIRDQECISMEPRASKPQLYYSPWFLGEPITKFTSMSYIVTFIAVEVFDLQRVIALGAIKITKNLFVTFLCKYRSSIE